MLDEFQREEALIHFQRGLVLERAKAAMKEDQTPEQVAAIQASLQKALAQLHVKRRPK